MHRWVSCLECLLSFKCLCTLNIFMKASSASHQIHCAIQYSPSCVCVSAKRQHDWILFPFQLNQIFGGGNIFKKKYTWIRISQVSPTLTASNPPWGTFSPHKNTFLNITTFLCLFFFFHWKPDSVSCHFSSYKFINKCLSWSPVSELIPTTDRMGSRSK